MAQSTTGKGRFGTFGGVFTPSILTIFGVIMFMRASFVVGEAGIIGAIAILLIAKLITLLTTFSVSAISTNMEVKGGGAYYMISRVLGPEFGGAVGAGLFIAASLSIPFYILGFTEALTLTFPVLTPYFLLIGLVIAFAIYAVTMIGAGWAIKTQYVIMVILFLSILLFIGGAVSKFSFDTFKSNLYPPETHTLIGYPRVNDNAEGLRKIYQENNLGRTLTDAQMTDKEAIHQEVDEFLDWVAVAKRYSFWIVFAIYFPAVTGILSGINMSGDLRNPQRSIPIGTLWAVGVGFVVYLIQMLLSGGAFDRLSLVNHPYDVLKDNAWLSGITLFESSDVGQALTLGGLIVAGGVIVASLSSALGSFMGAPRVLQALARDHLVPSLDFFGKGAGPMDEPRRAISFSFVITIAVLLWAGNSGGGDALNTVAGIVTMFFMFTYGTINLAAFIEHFGGNPSFRPRFRYFHWATALLGFLGCAAAAILIDATMAAFSLMLMMLLVWSISRQKMSADFYDARRGFVYDFMRKNLLRLNVMAEDNKNWRPTIMAFIGDPTYRSRIFTFSSLLEGGKGILFAVNLISSKIKDVANPSERARKLMLEVAKEKKIDVFPLIAVSEDTINAASVLFQTASVGSIRPNIVMFGAGPKTGAMVQACRTSGGQNMSLVVTRIGREPVEPENRRIDIWWRGQKNGNLMVLLAHMLTLNPGWRRTKIRLIRLIGSENGRESASKSLSDLAHLTRMGLEPMVLVSDHPFPDVFARHSGDADVVFIGTEAEWIDSEGEWYSSNQQLLEGLEGTVMMVCATGNEDMTA